MTSEAEATLTEWAGVYRDRDHRVRDAFAAGVTKSRIHALTGISRATIDRILRESVMTVTDEDIRTSVMATLDVHPVYDPTDPVAFDIDGITAELMAAYDLVGPAPTTTFDEIDHDEYWGIVAKHDADC